jgi:HEAT repeat protein
VEPLISHGESTQPKFDLFYTEMVERLPPQQRAERALELTINRYEGASNYIIENAQIWRGEITNSNRLSSLITTAINAPLIEIRMAAFEIYIAQFDLEKSPEQVDKLLQRLDEDPKKAGPWALWSMSIIGARGVDRERIFDELIFNTNHSDTNIRRWAVDSLAKFGGEEVIEPLLNSAKYDSSSIIQERAFCGLAQTGTLHVVERYSSLPGLLEIARDSQFSKQQKSWAYQALKEISNFYDIPNDPDLWEKRMLDVDMLRY